MIDTLPAKPYIVWKIHGYMATLQNKYGSATGHAEVTASLFEYMTNNKTAFFSSPTPMLGWIGGFEMYQWLAINAWKRIALKPSCLVIVRANVRSNIPWEVLFLKGLALAMMSPGAAFLDRGGDLVSETDEFVAVLERMDFTHLGDFNDALQKRT